MAHFYLDESLGEDVDAGGLIELLGPEARHAASVSRLRVGESVRLGNGRGLMLVVTATSVEKDRVEFSVDSVERVDAPRSRVVLVQALTKGDRDERAIEAATELGVDEVVPWAAQRSVSVWTGSKVERGVERWATIVREAAKQSIRPFVPTVGAHATTSQVCERFTEALILVLDPTGSLDAEAKWRELVGDAHAAGRVLVLVVGPEGGISPVEFEHFDAAGAHRVRLGTNILRSSTAGPAFLAAINGVLGRW
jgi:16S rRNA (uracil1498-N3)-methyltransferase